ncbi:MAG: hypothetical protein MUC35_02320 [Candidatus Margulisbacteria bacterium]|nr:hypothetical protein [Candidatus Margulisiibacteriota bacterium]
MTIGDTTYKTGGNIVFADSNESAYYVAESEILNNMDKAIENGILVNGMQNLMKRFRG